MGALMPLMAGLWLLLSSVAAPAGERLPAGALHVIEITPANVAELEAAFQTHGLHWPIEPEQTIPPLEVKRLPPDFPQIHDIPRRKGLFVRVVLPLALMENQRLREQRALAELFLRYPPERLGTRYRAWLERLMDDYRIPRQWDFQRRGRELMVRLDEVPVELVVAQAAMESGWGTSRFALHGNALFGQWTWSGPGLRPSEADPDSTHKVRAFPSLRASLRAYLHNLNSGRAYARFRALRAELRAGGQVLDPERLAQGLEAYSARGMAYVRELERMLRRPELARLGRVSLLLGSTARPIPG